MLKKVYPNIYVNEIPLPNNPLKALNSYIIVSDDNSLIIDTGFNLKECKDALMQGIKELNIDLKKTNLFITHLHSDHSGLAYDLAKEGVKVYASKIDGKMINDSTKDEFWEFYDSYIKLFGLEQDNMLLSDNPGYRYTQENPVDFIIVGEGYKFLVGDYSFEVVDIPGHTPGQIGLYEKNHKLFFCGDHILDRITPNIAFWGFEQDILAIYFRNLRKVYEYDIDYLFTSHRNIITDHRKRIDELLEHHEHRLDEILNIINNKKMTPRDIAANMHWDIRAKDWDDFPRPQKWFAVGEAVSHLEHLWSTGKVQKFNENGVLYYELKK